VAAGAAAAVLAPLSIQGIDDPVRFVAREIADVLDAQPRRIPVYLYDNADIAVDPNVPHIRTRQVKALSRLDFVRGIKVSAPRKVLGNYTKAAASFNERGEFAIYVGDAMLIFDLFRRAPGCSARWPNTGIAGAYRTRCRPAWWRDPPTCCRANGRAPGRSAGRATSSAWNRSARCSRRSAKARARRAVAAASRVSSARCAASA